MAFRFFIIFTKRTSGFWTRLRNRSKPIYTLGLWHMKDIGSLQIRKRNWSGWQQTELTRFSITKPYKSVDSSRIQNNFSALCASCWRVSMFTLAGINYPVLGRFTDDQVRKMLGISVFPALSGFPNGCVRLCTWLYKCAGLGLIGSFLRENVRHRSGCAILGGSYWLESLKARVWNIATTRSELQTTWGKKMENVLVCYKNKK